MRPSQRLPPPTHTPRTASPFWWSVLVAAATAAVHRNAPNTPVGVSGAAPNMPDGLAAAAGCEEGWWDAKLGEAVEPPDADESPDGEFQR